ncbi:MAG: primosomal protein N', partial [Bacteroidota bacterium]
MSESRITRFAFVLVPLALPKTLIYRVPYEWNEEIQPGMRVIVPIGNARLYTGVVRELTETPPEGYTARYIEGLLDEFPLVSAEQFAFWDWMAAYYCCTPGEVMNAALPGGLKLSSETRIALVDDDWMEDASLSDREREI